MEFRRYRVFDSSAVREFYSILRAAIKGARSIGRLDLLVNDQMVPRIMGKIPYTDWREWATKRPEWVREDLGTAFERFVERKWKDALNVAAAEPLPWEPEGPKKEKMTSSKAVAEKAPQGQRGVTKTVGAANVVTQQPIWGHRKCRVQEQTGCEGDHLVLRCGKLRKLSLSERRRALEASGLCMFCLRHPTDAECFDQGGRTKPSCVQPGCKGKYTAGVHELLGGVDASVNLVAEEDHEMEEDKDLYVNVARIGQEEDDWQEPDDSWLELDRGESEEEVGVYCISACLRKDDSGLEDELEYFHDVTPPPEEEGAAEVRWWSPKPQGLQSEEENQYSVNLLIGSLKTGSNNSELTQSQTEAAVAPVACDLQTLEEESEEEKRRPQEDVTSSEPPAKKKFKRRMPRKKEVRGEREKWETARRDAWLRELLTESSECEPEDRYSRFEESSRRIAEMKEGVAEAGPVGPRDASDEDVVRGAVATLDMLDERASRMGERLEEIEERVRRLGEGEKVTHVKKRTRREDGSDLRGSEGLRARQAGGGRVGKTMLMLSVLGMFSGQVKAQEGHDGH